MCFQSYQKVKSEPQIAKEDIVCYKVCNKIQGNEYVTPHFHSKVEIGQTYTSELGNPQP